ncbi:MAG: DUF3617 domain-containing protein [Hyphomicrobiaceae bacterium]
MPYRTNPSTRTVALAVGWCILPFGLAAAESPWLLPGLYEVDVRLELPHIENTTPPQIETLCLTDTGIKNNGGFAVLSQNNSLAHCPISNVDRLDNRLTFDILCEGSNMGRGSAIYTVGPDRFAGRIAMKMGGKNMTMTEVQHGRRIGDCSGPKVPR